MEHRENAVLLETCRRGVVSGLLVAASCLTATSAGAQVTAIKIHARVSNPGFTVADNTLSSVVLPTPDGEATASVTTSFGGPTLSAESTAVSMLSNAAVGYRSHWSGQSASGTGTLRSALSGGWIDFRDEVAVTSPILPDGTPVVVTFSFFAAHTHAYTSTAAEPSNNNAGVLYHLSLVLTSGVAPNTPLSIPNSVHRFQEDLFLVGTLISDGIMNPAIAQVDYDFDTEVGDTIDVFFRLTSSVGGSVWSTGVGNLNVESGSGSGELGLAFGASPAVADVDLESMTFSGDFPSQSMATLANAQSVFSQAAPVPALSPGPQVLLVAAVLSFLALALWVESARRRQLIRS